MKPGTAVPADGRRGLWLDGAGHRDDLGMFVQRAARLDDAAVVRLRKRPGGLVVAWVATGLDVLASRVVAGRVRPDDLCAGADALDHGLSVMDDVGYVDPGFSLDSAWRGVLPPDNGFVHLDDVPAQVMLDLAQRGAELAREHGSAHGPPASLLDQDVVLVKSGAAPAATSGTGQAGAGIPLRCVFALTAMGFLPSAEAGGTSEEIVRVRVLPAWLRIDARFGSVYRRRGDPALVLR